VPLQAYYGKREDAGSSDASFADAKYGKDDKSHADFDWVSQIGKPSRLNL